MYADKMMHEKLHLLSLRMNSLYMLHVYEY